MTAAVPRDGQEGERARERGREKRARREMSSRGRAKGSMHGTSNTVRMTVVRDQHGVGKFSKAKLQQV
jgi:hypothetical protein